MSYSETARSMLITEHEEWADKYEGDFNGLGNYQVGWDPLHVRKRDITSALGILGIAHFQFPVGRSSQRILSQAVDIAVDYFTGDWWKDDPESARVMDKSTKRRGLLWFRVFDKSLLLALLSRRRKDVQRICDWVEYDIPPEYNCADEREKERGDVYKIIASALRSSPFEEIDRLHKRMKRCKAPHSMRLYATWQAATTEGGDAYRDALIDSLKYFKKHNTKARTPYDWIALDESVVVLAAEQLGVERPSLPDDLQGLVITPESIQER